MKNPSMALVKAVISKASKAMTNVEGFALAKAITTTKTNMMRFAMLVPHMGPEDASDLLREHGFIEGPPA